MIDTNKIVPDGFILLQTQNGTPKYAACMTGRLAGWLMKKYPDGNWVSERKLTNLEVMQAEDQRDDGIVHETPAATIQEPVMVAEPVGDLMGDIKKAIRLADAVGVSRADNRYARNEKAVEELVDLELSIYRRLAAPMVADPAGVGEFDFDEWFSEHSAGVQLRIFKEFPDFKAAIRKHYTLAATVKAVPSEALDWRAMCDSMLDVWDDAQKNPPESRCYLEGAWPAILAEIREALAAPLADKTGGGE